MFKKFFTVLTALTCAFCMVFTSVAVSAEDSVEDVVYGNYIHGFADFTPVNNCDITATRGVSFAVTIPKLLTMDGMSGNVDYVVNVRGDIAGDQYVNVVPESSFIMNEAGGKADVTASVSQDKLSWNYVDVMVKGTDDEYIGTDTNGLVTAPITAGNWSGHFFFNIELTDSAFTNVASVGTTSIEEGFPGLYDDNGILSMTWNDIVRLFPDSFVNGELVDGGYYWTYGDNEEILTGDTLVVSDSIGTIGYNAFAGLNVRAVILPDTVTYIDEYAFSEMPSLEFVHIPTSVTYIGDGIFTMIDDPTVIWIEYDNKTYSVDIVLNAYCTDFMNAFLEYDSENSIDTGDWFDGIE